MTSVGRPLAAAGVMALVIASLAGCGNDAGGGTDKAAGTSVALTATDTQCQVAKTDLPAGHVTFTIANKGSQVTEVYVYRADQSIVSERENIGPGTSADLVVELKAGAYEVACKPGMKGDGIRQKITVTGDGAASTDARLNSAVANYRTWVQQQVDDSVVKTEAFVAAVKAGDVAKAKSLYAPSRVGWESVEPVAESFGDLDPKIDAREADLEPGQEFTGWHRLEKALWVPGSVSAADQKKYADQLIVDLKDLQSKVKTVEITATSMANGAKELLDEVATGKVTGEEEAFSHTDLWDFDANVAGAKKAFELLKPVVGEKDKALADTLDKEFADVEAALAKYRQGDGFVSYDKVTQQQRKELSDAVNALGEPLSKLAAAVTP